MERLGKRTRKPAQLPSDYIDADEAVDINEAVTKPRKRRAGSHRPRPAAVQESDLELSLDQAAAGDHSSHGSEPTGCDSDDANSKGSCSEDEANSQQQQAPQRLDAPLGKKSLQQLNKKVNATLAPLTRQNYDNYIAVFEKWMEANGYQGNSSLEHNSSKSRKNRLDIGKLDNDKVVNTFYRFFDWWIVQGRPGDTAVGGRLVGAGEYGRSTAMKLHSALQKHLDACRRAAGADTFTLNQAPPYDGLYKVYCSKKRDQVLVKAIAEGSTKALVHMSFGRDAYVRGVHMKLASDKPEDACTLSMCTAQVAMVARGDDIRPRTLRHLATRLLSCVGPSTAVALTILQPPTAGKTLGSRPAYKGMLRSKLPECCAVGNLFRWMVIRFTVLAEPIPKPGSSKLAKYFLWPGRAGEAMSRNSHGERMDKLFTQLGVETNKLTHEFRIFAAQLMYEMGVSLEVIQRIGHWLLDSFGTAYIVPGFTAEALLALAFWPGAAQKDFTGYWAERFHVAVPEVLIQLLMPGLAAMEQEATAAAAAGNPDAEADNLCRVLRMGAVVVVQDALELAERFPNNPVHKLLLEQPTFQALLQNYKTFKALGGFEPQRPLTVKQTIKDLLTKHTQTLVQHVNSALGLSAGASGLQCSGAAGLTWQGFDQLRKESEQDALQQQQHPLTPEEVMETLEKVAAGQIKPSAELVQRVRQQKDVLNEPEDSSQPACTTAATAAQQPPLRPVAVEQPVAAGAVRPGQLSDVTGAAVGAAPNSAAAAAVEGLAVSDSPTAAVTANSYMPAAEGAAAASSQGNKAAAPNLVAAAAAAAHRAGSPDVQVAFMVEEPQDQLDMFSTPSGKRYSHEQLTQRTVDTLTPNGTHCTTFYLGQPAQQQTQQQQQGARLSSQQPQGQQGQDADTVPGLPQSQQGMSVQEQQHKQQGAGRQVVQYTQQAVLLIQLKQQQQQQQQLLELMTRQQQELAQLRPLLSAQQRTLGQEVPPVSSGSDSQHSATQQLQQQQLVMQQQLQDIQRALLLQQQQGQQLQGLQQQGSAFLQGMGSVDPIANIYQPYTTSQPSLNAVLGAASNSVMAAYT